MKAAGWLRGLVLGTALAAAPAVFPATAAADEGLMHRESVSAGIKASDRLGYDVGLELRVGSDVKYGVFGASLEAGASNARKRGADNGYTYFLLGSGRLFYRRAFIGVGLDCVGYSSEFSDSAVWEKDAKFRMLEAGYFGPFFEASGRYLWEDDTENKSRVVLLRGSIELDKGKRIRAWLYVEGGIQTFDPRWYTPDGQLKDIRERGNILNWGVRAEF